MNKPSNMTDLEIQESYANKTSDELIEIILKLVDTIRRLNKEILLLGGGGYGY